LTHLEEQRQLNQPLVIVAITQGETREQSIHIAAQAASTEKLACQACAKITGWVMLLNNNSKHEPKTWS